MKINEILKETMDKDRCAKCGMKDCKCPGDTCKCKPIAGWIPDKGFKKDLDEDMSRAAKGYEKYGKKGMQALAKAGRDGKDLDPVRAKYNKYDEDVNEEWSQKYKSSINCSHPKGFSQKAHCAGKKKHNESVEMEMTCEDCGMCQSHGNLSEIKKGAKDSNGVTKCWSGYHAAGTKQSATTGKSVRNCVKNEDIDKDSSSCPPATQDIKLNLKNRQKAIDEYGYGPLNPTMPNVKFWMKKADEWNLDDPDEAKSSLCGNCAAFNQSPDMLDCMAQGIGDDSYQDPIATVEAGDLGYCQFLKFKCASRRTCDAWVVGGPITKNKDEGVAEAAKKGLYYNVNKRKAAGTSRDASSPNAPTAQAWKDAAKTAKNESVAEGDIGKHNNATTGFAALSKKAGKGNKAKGDAIAGAQLAKMRAKGQVEEDSKGYKSPTGGLTQKGRDHYNRTTGSHLKAPVTKKPSELKPGGKAAKRRKSFCARMGGNKGPMKKPNGQPTRKALALRKWNCESIEQMRDMIILAEQVIAEAKKK